MLLRQPQDMISDGQRTCTRGPKNAISAQRKADLKLKMSPKAVNVGAAMWRAFEFASALEAAGHAAVMRDYHPLTMEPYGSLVRPMYDEMMPDTVPPPCSAAHVGRDPHRHSCSTKIFDAIPSAT